MRDMKLLSVLSDIEISAIKTGMLYDAANTRAVAKTLRAFYADGNVPPLVCDPVCVSTSGHTLLHPDAIEVLISDLFPIAALITPNKSEAELLLSRHDKQTQIKVLEDMLTASKDLLSLGPAAVLLKGGHLIASISDVDRVSAQRSDILIIRDGLLGENMEILQIAEEDLGAKPLVVDVLATADSLTLFVRPRVETTSTHGTGCTLSAALTCALSRGKNGQFVELTRAQKTYTTCPIHSDRGYSLGESVYPPRNRDCKVNRERKWPTEPSSSDHFAQYPFVSVRQFSTMVYL